MKSTDVCQMVFMPINRYQCCCYYATCYISLRFPLTIVFTLLCTFFRCCTSDNVQHSSLKHCITQKTTQLFFYFSVTVVIPHLLHNWLRILRNKFSSIPLDNWIMPQLQATMMIPCHHAINIPIVPAWSIFNSANTPPTFHHHTWLFVV